MSEPAAVVPLPLRPRVTLRDDSLPHQIRIFQPGTANKIAVSCNCLRIRRANGAVTHTPIELRVVWGTRRGDGLLARLPRPGRTVMRLPSGPFETKVAASTAVPVIVGAVFTAAAYYHWFSPPPLPVTASIVTILTGAAGWLAPHTPRGVVSTPGDIMHHRTGETDFTPPGSGLGYTTFTPASVPPMSALPPTAADTAAAPATGPPLTAMPPAADTAAEIAALKARLAGMQPSPPPVPGPVTMTAAPPAPGGQA